MAGLQAVAGILEAADGRTGMLILDNLAARDRSLAERLGPRPIEFDDLADLDDDVLGELDPERRGKFWASLDGEPQLIATGTSMPQMDPSTVLGAGGAWQVFEVVGGAIRAV